MSRGLGCLPAPKYPITLNGYIYSPGKKIEKIKKKSKKKKKLKKKKKCSEQFLGPLPGP